MVSGTTAGSSVFARWACRLSAVTLNRSGSSGTPTAVAPRDVTSPLARVDAPGPHSLPPAEPLLQRGRRLGIAAGGQVQAVVGEPPVLRDALRQVEQIDEEGLPAGRDLADLVAVEGEVLVVRRRIRIRAAHVLLLQRPQQHDAAVRRREGVEEGVEAP